MDLKEFFRQHPKAAIAFSGGVDSSYLLYAALQCGADVRAYYVKGAFQPQFELDDAQRLARDIHAPMTVLRADVLRDETVTANPANRCYYCKKVVFSSIAQAALADGIRCCSTARTRATTQATAPACARAAGAAGALAAAPVRPDEAGDPAAVERGEAIHLGQARLRVSRHAHPDGGRRSPPKLSATESAEGELFAMGFTDFRVRWYAGAARLQFPAVQLPRVLERREEILTKLKNTIRRCCWIWRCADEQRHEKNA